MEWTGTAVVTGASRGIGRAVAVDLAVNVGDLILIGRDEAGLQETAAACGDARVTTAVVDLADPIALERTLKILRDRDVSYVVHAAGDGLPARIEDVDLIEVGRLFEVNCASFIRIAQAVLPRMRAHGFGRIVAIGSLAPLRPQAFSVPYSATKAALRAVVQSLAVELVTDGVLVNMVSPGGVATRLGEAGRASYQNLNESDPRIARASRAGHLPVGTAVEPNDVARAALYLLDPANRVVCGQDLVIAGTQVMR